MESEKLLAVELALEDRLRTDLNALPVRPYAHYRDIAMQRRLPRPGAAGRVFSVVDGTTLVVALLFAFAAALVLLNLRGPIVPAGPTPSPALSTAPPASLGSTATSTPGASVSSPAPTPIGFLLPQGCSIVGEPIVEQPAQIVVTTWYFNCGAAPDRQAIERLTPAFAQQGWTMCPSGPGRGVWWKGTLQTAVGQSAVGNPVLTQLTRQSQDCP